MSARPLVADFLHDRRRLAAVATLLAGIAAQVFYYRDPFPAAYENYDDGLTRAYEKIASVVRPWEVKDARIVLFGREQLQSLEDRQLVLDSQVTYRPSRRGAKKLHVRVFGPRTG
jgi:hypothetical protein